MATKQEKIEIILNELKTATADIQGLAILSPDGMMIVNMLGSGDGDAGAAMGAAVGSLGNRVTETLKLGGFEEITIRGDKASLLLFDLDGSAYLMLKIAVNSNLGLVLLEAREAKGKLASVF
jgi:predicted regulator of Ras-like GTPase activity (Roadblock/LC7/MglB family)